MIATSQVAAQASTRALFSRLRATFSFPSMLACMLMLLSVLTVRSRFDDPDMWWHLKLGQIIWTTHSIPRIDTLSYTTGHHAYIAHEWLSQLVIYGAYKIGGYSGLMLWLCFFSATLLITGYVLCSLYSGNLKVAFLGALTIWIFATSGMAIRPQMIGYCLLIVELLCIHLGRTRNALWFYVLPPLFAVWINSHGSFLFGIVTIALFLFSSFFDFHVGGLVAEHWSFQERRVFAMCGLASVAALFLNASGIKQILYPLNVMLHQPVVTSQVQEWFPLDLAGVRGVAFVIVLMLISLAVILWESKFFFHELLLLVASAFVAVSHRRMVFVFGIIAAPILSRVLAASWDRYDATIDRPAVNAVFIAATLAVAFYSFPSRQMLIKQVNENSPVRAVDFIKSHKLPGRMINSFEYGGYLIWAAPEYPVFIDGRADIFDWTGVFRSYGNWATLQSDPRKLLDEYNVNFCILERGSPMVTLLPLLPGWKMLYQDQNSAVIARSDPKPLITSSR